jgi:UDP-N-acetyl-D-galactosamine dehydrogenase
VDPYYLTHKAQQIGHHADMILAGRRINDGMGGYVARRLVRLMSRCNGKAAPKRVLVLGLAFKENCPDLRNTKVVISSTSCAIQRPGRRARSVVSAEHAHSEYGIDLVSDPDRASTTPSSSPSPIASSSSSASTASARSARRTRFCST